MRISVVRTEAPEWPKMVWVELALRELGHDVLTVMSPAELVVADAESDLVLFQHKSPIRWPNLRPIAERKQSVWVQWWFDLFPEGGLQSIQQYVPIMQSMDLVLVKEKEVIKSLSQVGVRAHWLDQGVPVFPESEPSRGRVHDVLVWGQGRPSYSRRYDDAMSLACGGFRVLWLGAYGHVVPKQVIAGPWTHPEQLPVRESRMVLSVDLRQTPGYVSDRLWIAMMLGGCCLVRRGGWADLEVEDVPALRYTTNVEMMELASMVRSGSIDGEELGCKAREWAITNRSTTVQCRRLMKLVQEAARSVVEPEPSR